MTSDLVLTSLHARPILDSRGYPTVEVTAEAADGAVLRAASPAGASTGAHEAVELRDGGPAFSGKGVDGAVRSVEVPLAELLVGPAWSSLEDADAAMAELDSTQGYANLGANAVVAVSMVLARGFAHAAGMELWEWFAAHTGSTPLLPVPHFNVLNGGAHAANDLDLQEFMIAPVGARDEAEAVAMGAEAHHALGALVRERYGTAGLGDEGGFAPPLSDPREALDLLMEAMGQAGLVPGREEMAIALDPAANGFHRGSGVYRIAGRDLDREQLAGFYAQLLADYPIRSLEDGFAEDDLEGWRVQARELGGRVQLVGDDLYVTDPVRIRDGAARGLSDAVLIKPNQIGTISQTLAAIRTARDASMACMISHRSGETWDDFIADLAVGTGVGQIKAGAPARGERVAKYNRLAGIARSHPELPYGLS
jgi:enolase